MLDVDTEHTIQHRDHTWEVLNYSKTSINELLDAIYLECDDHNVMNFRNDGLDTWLSVREPVLFSMRRDADGILTYSSTCPACWRTGKGDVHPSDFFDGYEVVGIITEYSILIFDTRTA